MPRAMRVYPDLYFGKPGALVQLPWPRGELEATIDQSVSVFRTGSGSHRVSRLVTEGGRLYTVNWNALHQSTFDRLNQYWVGQMGLGPFTFIDPSRPNLLTGNQSGATSMWNDARGFTPEGLTHGLVFSNQDSTLVHRLGGPRSLRWFFSGTLASFPQLNFDPPYRAWYGVPVAPFLSYAFSVWVKPVVDTTITIAAKLQWRDVAGTQISLVTSGDIATTDWTRLSVIATAPFGTAFARPMLVVTGSTVTTPASVYVDEPLLEQDTVLNDWAPGTGVMPVQIESFVETAPFDGRFRLDPQLTIREVVA